MKIKNEKTGKIKDIRLPKKFKEKWVKALRSGKYIQAQNVLYDFDKSSNGKLAMCCLGVGEHICGTSLEDMNNEDLSFPNELKKSNLPDLLISDYNPRDCNNIPTKLAKMNDNGKSFKQIAAYIERYL